MKKYKLEEIKEQIDTGYRHCVQQAIAMMMFNDRLEKSSKTKRNKK